RLDRRLFHNAREFERQFKLHLLAKAVRRWDSFNLGFRHAESSRQNNADAPGSKRLRESSLRTKLPIIPSGPERRTRRSQRQIQEVTKKYRRSLDSGRGLSGAFVTLWLLSFVTRACPESSRMGVRLFWVLTWSPS